MTNLEFSVDKEIQKYIEENPWVSFIPEFARDNEGRVYMRKQNSKVIYLQIKDEYECLKCGSRIMDAKVAHRIQNGSFPCSGSGRYHYEQVLYCPECEEKPKFDGEPIIQSNFSYFIAS